MIFVCVGSREYQFNRLLIEIDRLIEKNVITDQVFAQIGQSTYVPKNYEYKQFLSTAEFKQKQEAANLIISHAGTGALMGALKLGKKVIAVPRLEKYREHTDDHQLQISSILSSEGYLVEVIDIKELGNAINNIMDDFVLKSYNKPSNIMETIVDFIES